MKTKMGRPKVPKAKLRAILVQARLSPEENRQIEAAVSKYSGTKSDWIREALIRSAQKEAA
jgi:hypothetical protein